MAYFTEDQSKGVIPKNPSMVLLPELRGKTWRKDAEFPCKKSWRFGILRNSFAVPNGNEIDIYSQNGDITQQFQYHQMKNIQCLIQSGDDLIVGAQNGLFCTTTNGTFRYKIADGHFIDLTSYQGVVFGLEYDNNRVCTLTNKTNRWTTEVLFHNEKLRKDSLNTLLVTADNVFICFRSAHTVLKFTHSGMMVSEHGTCKKNGGPGQLYGPSLSTTDMAGNLLLCDYSNKCLQMLKLDGSWELFWWPGLHQMCDVLLQDENTLWCLAHYDVSDVSIVKYVCDQ